MGNIRTKKPGLRWIRSPVQERSQKSLERILDATEEILEEKSFSEITVDEIVKKARSSVGVFYSRFPDKLALLHHLDERFSQEAEETLRQHLDYQTWKDCSFAEISSQIIEFLCRIHAEKKGMLRSIILQVRTRPDLRFQQTGKRLARLINRICDFLLNWRQEINHPHPAQALRFALVMVVSLIHEYTLFSETTMYQKLLHTSQEDFRERLGDSFRRLVAAVASSRS